MEEHKYEITYIIRPDMEEGAKNDLVTKFDKVLTDNGAKIIDSKDWSKRRFAYEIAGYNEGVYHVVNLTTADKTALDEFDRQSKFSDDILRQMTVRR
ncbi:30S ribosomal protein S6 [Apilactobacillus kunkeei]|uniref:Small ribosomal subunit protein bS6 n=2 Tax=Apilactobacillus kunkeei TaxID=148814 RepID=A0AAC8WBF5_9LACO|nr:30S ribosomal protein S6 [Apilactobacillus kunkeei]ALJ31204.1 30S ribosomal protein S6 [Apilactobacillus kunkeei]KFJ15748.1 30S ribosomal protein S6 [Apilactobacillus kunkeei]KIM18720.1 30S ribosomal protein S6 [Apilactobacillus kunkeei]KOY70586.1 30S ribosomal protein S6 [Apilactobacillus kunkeei]KOY75051.1 SSU ribosomal protein S6p [Apilactobacillus kunkeei DSM 12361 = ATCC 700308]